MRKTVDETLRHPDDTVENPSITYSYDNLMRLTEETATESTDGYSGDYVYDLSGNRTKREVITNNGTVTTDYVYDANTDRLISESHDGPVAAIPYNGERVFAYADNIGRLTYQLPGSDKRIGQFKAFFLGLYQVLATDRGDAGVVHQHIESPEF